MSVSEIFSKKVPKVIEENFQTHPFTYGITEDNFEQIISNYLAMSMAFPYLQAGVHYRLISNCIQQDKDVPQDIEITSKDLKLYFSETKKEYLKYLNMDSQISIL